MLVLNQASLALLVHPPGHIIAPGFEFIPGYTKATGSLDRVYFQDKYLARVWPGLKPGIQIGPSRISGADYLAVAEEAENQRFLAKTAKHDRHPAIFEDMSGGFIAAANEVKKSDCFMVKAAKRIHPFGREINSSLRRRGSDKEQLLFGDKFFESRIQLWVKLSHLYPPNLDKPEPKRIEPQRHRGAEFLIFLFSVSLCLCGKIFLLVVPEFDL
jgi:hypothetical protein